MSLSPHKLKHKIFDDLYGIIHLTETEWQLINSVYFQRLRRIKQLGLANYVFPGAEHTRFAHSIGVLGITERIFQHLHGKIDEKEEEIFRIAALLHDIGHFPLSHTIEASYSSYISGQIKIEYMQPKDNSKCDEVKKSRRQGPKLHEKMGAYIVQNTDRPGGIKKILKDNGFDETKIGDIANIITGSHDNMLFNQLMHSDLDVDRIDYMNRDAKNSGIIYGMFDSEYLIESMELVDKPDTKHKILCIKSKGLGALEDFFFARYHYYTKIIYHRMCFFFDRIAQAIYEKLIELEEVYTYEKIEDLYKSGEKEEIFAFNDDYFFQAIIKCKEEKKCQEIDKFIDAILFRLHCEIVKEKQFWISKEEFAEKSKSVLKEFKDNNTESNKFFDQIQKTYFQFCSNEKEIEEECEPEAFDSNGKAIYDLRDPVRLLLNKRVSYAKDKDTKIYDKIGESELIALCNYDHSLLSELSNKKLCIFRYFDINKL